MEIERIETLVLKQMQLVAHVQQRLEDILSQQRGFVDDNNIQQVSQSLLHLVEAYQLLLPQDDANYFLENITNN